MGIYLLTIGLAICFHNFMLLALNRVEKPDSISVVIAFVALAVYTGLYKHSKGDGNNDIKDCMRTRQNSHWQNRMNLFSGVTVVLGLVGTMFGFIFMDEFAAIVVGSILIAMGVKLIIETRLDLSTVAKRYFKQIVLSRSHSKTSKKRHL